PDRRQGACSLSAAGPARIKEHSETGRRLCSRQHHSGPDPAGTYEAEGQLLQGPRWGTAGLRNDGRGIATGENRELDESSRVRLGNPDLHHVYASLARDFTLLRYDARGNGLSDWDVEDISLDAWVKDLETVVDAAG